MGGAAPVESGKGRKKALDAELNLVPFIDLLSCLISFLLITAVWTQVSSLKAAATGSLGGDPSDEVRVRLTITERGYELEVGAATPVVIAKRLGNEGSAFDTEALATALQHVRADVPDQKSITVAVEDGVRFEDLSAALDRAAAVAFTEPAVTPLN